MVSIALKLMTIYGLMEFFTIDHSNQLTEHARMFYH